MFSKRPYFYAWAYFCVWVLQVSNKANIILSAKSRFSLKFPAQPTYLPSLFPFFLSDCEVLQTNPIWHCGKKQTNPRKTAPQITTPIRKTARTCFRHQLIYMMMITDDHLCDNTCPLIFFFFLQIVTWPGLRMSMKFHFRSGHFISPVGRRSGITTERGKCLWKFLCTVCLKCALKSQTKYQDFIACLTHSFSSQVFLEPLWCRALF